MNSSFGPVPARARSAGAEGENGQDALPETAMDRDEVITRLRAHEADLHQAGVARLSLFGSVARPDSDVDLFFDTDNPRFSLIEWIDVKDRVSDILGTETAG
jgi:uncharacterized protein